jgi:uncharacterized Zn finger protein
VFERHCHFPYVAPVIRASTDCPACGRQLNVSYRTLRLGRTVECQGCGEMIMLEDHTPIAAMQKMIDGIEIS